MRKVVCRLSRGKTIVYGSFSDDDLTDTYVPTTPAEHLEFDKVDKTFKISRSESDNLVKHECRDYLKLADEAEPEQPRKELGFEIVSSGKDYAEAGEIFPLGFEIVSGGKDFCDEAVEQLPSAEHSILLWDFMLSDQMHCKKDLIEVTDIAVGPQIVSNADVLFTFDELSSMTTNFESSNLIPSLDNTFYGFHPTHGKVVVHVFLRSDTSQTRMYESALCRPKSHPNVATFLGRSCDDPDFLCIVYKLPYCDTLATILNDPSFDLSKRLRVALCVARGVEYLTAFDKFPSAPLSPDHIFLQEDGSASIMDYLGDTAGKTEDIISQYSAILLLLFPSSLKVNGGETILKFVNENRFQYYLESTAWRGFLLAILLDLHAFRRGRNPASLPSSTTRWCASRRLPGNSGEPSPGDQEQRRICSLSIGKERPKLEGAIRP